MRCNGLPYTASPQTLLAFPLARDTGLVTILFYLFFAVCLKNSLPGQSDAAAKVTNIHHPLMSKTFSNERINALIDLPHICDRSLPPLKGRCLTEEKDT